MEGAPSDIDGEVNDRDIVLKEVSGEPPDDATNQDDQREAVFVQVQRIGEFLDRKRRIGIQLPVSPGTGFLGSVYQPGGILELRHHPVNRLLHDYFASSDTLACGSKVRTSKMEIMGNKRMNRKNRNRDNPIVPR